MSETIAFPPSIYVMDAENDPVYPSGFSSKGEAIETAACVGGEVREYIQSIKFQEAAMLIRMLCSHTSSEKTKQKAKDWIVKNNLNSALR